VGRTVRLRNHLTHGAEGCLVAIARFWQLQELICRSISYMYLLLNNSYQPNYYHQWTRKPPLLQHRLRGTVVDVRHTILPETNRPNLAQSNRSQPPVLYLAPKLLSVTPLFIDMVLHSTAHAFHGGKLANLIAQPAGPARTTRPF
jgi:hypothetical protein